MFGLGFSAANKAQIGFRDFLKQIGLQVGSAKAYKCSCWEVAMTGTIFKRLTTACRDRLKVR